MRDMSPAERSDRMYGGIPRSARLEGRRRRLVDATLDLVHEGGVVGLTVGAVCTRASLAKRYFYESFDSLDGLLSTALQDVFDQVAIAIERARSQGNPTPEQVLTAAVEGVLDAMDDPRAARLYLESAGNLALLATRDEAVRAFVDQLLASVTSRPATDADAQLVAHLLVSGSTHVIAMWLRGDIALGRDDFVNRLVGLGTLAVAGIR